MPSRARRACRSRRGDGQAELHGLRFVRPAVLRGRTSDLRLRVPGTKNGRPDLPVPNGPGRLIYACETPLARIQPGPGPVVAVALHAGHTIRAGLSDYVTLPDDQRLREEDPYTARMVPDGIPCVEVLRSRFEVDLNRPRRRAVMRGPDDAWGLSVYCRDLPADVERASLHVYDEFYRVASNLLARVSRRHGRFVVLDLHSYNHRRDGAAAPPAPVAENPEVNLGTLWVDRERWDPVVTAFLQAMTAAGFDCRENVKFRGGHFARWVSESFAGAGVVLAVEFKKTFMDEWTGQLDEGALERIRSALAEAVGRVSDSLETVT